MPWSASRGVTRSPRFAEVVGQWLGELIDQVRIGMYCRRALPLPDCLGEHGPFADLRGCLECPDEVGDEVGAVRLR